VALSDGALSQAGGEEAAALSAPISQLGTESRVPA